MKYLFVNSVAGIGSTGRIVAEQSRDLNKAGHRCLIAYGREKANIDDIESFRICNKAEFLFNVLQTRVCDNNGFSIEGSTKRLIQKIEDYDPDVIWLHNLHGYYINVQTLFDYLKTCEKRIYWTLHDCWAFTGHCAYYTAARCNQWQTLCRRCSELKRYPACFGCSNVKKNFEKKRDCFTHVPNMTLVTPSYWLKTQVEQSFLRDYSVEVVHNHIDANVFKPTVSSIRKEYGIDTKKMLLGVAAKMTDRKGFLDFLELSKYLDNSFVIVLVGLNKQQLKRLPNNIIGIQNTSSAEKLASLYSAADIFINLTHEDNYPTVNLEAQACGTPVITYDVGGSPESCKAENIISEGDTVALVNRIHTITSGII